MSDKDVTTTTENPTEALQITAGEIALVVKIFDTGSERGAWKGEEMSTIGTLRDKLAAIVRAVSPQEETEKTEEAVEETASLDENTENDTQ
jgi:hypothetical protein